MRQNSTVTASSEQAARGVVFGWAIRGSFRRGFGWPPFYRQTSQHSSRAANRGQIRSRRGIGRQEGGVLGGDQELVQVTLVAVARAHPGYLAVGVVEDDVLADAVAQNYPAFPPGEHGPAPVALDPEVPRGAVLAKPYELPLVVDDHRAVLACALLQGEEHVVRRGALRLHRNLDCCRAKVGARTEGPHALRGRGWDAWQRPDLRGAQGSYPWGLQGPELRDAPQQSAVGRARQGEAGRTGAQHLKKAASGEPT